MTRTEAQWIAEYEKAGALWIHNGDPQKPHAELRSKKHSSGFFDTRLVIPNTALLRDAACDLVELFATLEGKPHPLHYIDCVVGPQTGATKLAEFISNQIDHIAPSLTGCFSLSPAKHEENGVKSMVFSDEERELLPRKLILLCEDVLTTGGSVELTSKAVIDAGGIVLPYILVLVNRSGEKEVNGKKIISLIENPMPTWEPQDCPLCKGGSKPISDPKDNWAELTA